MDVKNVIIAYINATACAGLLATEGEKISKTTLDLLDTNSVTRGKIELETGY